MPCGSLDQKENGCDWFGCSQKGFADGACRSRPIILELHRWWRNENPRRCDATRRPCRLWDVNL